ncbi:MAG: polysaccharide deacetylase [Dehalococcoidia bacterium]
MAGLWPDDIQCVVNLGFDIDGESSWIGKDPANAHRPVLTTMGEYGPRVGVPRILQMLDDYGIKASFFIPGHTAESHPEMVKKILAQGHEVAGHGYMHERPADITPEQEVETLDKGLGILEKVAGQKVKGYRVPGGEPSKQTMSLLAERDLLYDSSLMDDDAPYILNTEKGGLVEIPWHWLLDDFPYYHFAPAAGMRGPMDSPISVSNTWIAEFDGLYKEGRCMVLVLHPQITGHPSRLSGLERTIQHMLTRPNVAFMRAVDIAEYWLSRGA